MSLNRGGGGILPYMGFKKVCAASNLGYDSNMVFTRFRYKISILAILVSHRVS